MSMCEKGIPEYFGQWLLGVCWQCFNWLHSTKVWLREGSRDGKRMLDRKNMTLGLSFAGQLLGTDTKRCTTACENHLSDIQEDLFTVCGFLGSITLHCQSLGITLMVGQVGSHSSKKQLAARFPWPSWCGGWPQCIRVDIQSRAELKW